MKLYRPFLLLLVFLSSGMIGTQGYAEYSPNEILMKATRLNCTFTSEQQTRWGSGGPLREDGPILSHVTFDSINHQTGEGKILWPDGNLPVRIREFSYSITFFELSKSGDLDPVITTVLDDYYSGTTKFIAVRSEHVTSAFKRALAIQKHGTCVAGE